jgi:hypothetical protein
MQLKDITPIIAAILMERDKIPRNPRSYHDGNMIRGGIRKALRVIEQAPAIDATPVVRCEACEARCRQTGMCSEWMQVVDANGFCYKGRRETKET